jgi:lipopolysaccharide/colanic/teichoic acid biosynthesis glycosyltransferase
MKFWTRSFPGFVAGVFDRCVAASILLLSAPVFALIYVCHRALDRDGGGFLYKGERMGKDKKSFCMYKIRTLKEGSESILGHRLHTSGNGMELKSGPFLRKTRLDELPQFLNVLKGDMALVGPRPVRRAVYEQECRDISGYDLRFTVKPGITGLSQFLTPHNTDKKIRARFDRMLIRKMANPLWRLYFVLWTGMCVARSVTAEALTSILRALNPKNGNRPDYSIHVAIENEMTSPMPLNDFRLNGQYIEAVCPSGLSPGSSLELTFVGGRSNRRIKIARCRAVVIEETSGSSEDSSHKNKSTSCIQYQPVSRLQKYLLDRHILKSTVV